MFLLYRVRNIEGAGTMEKGAYKSHKRGLYPCLYPWNKHTVRPYILLL